MKANASPVGPIVAGMLIVATLMSFTVEGGWFVWVPVAGALFLSWVFARSLG